jgi:hypothetical protein
MMVCLIVLGAIAAVVTLAIRRTTPPDPTDPMTTIADTIETVLTTGIPVTLKFIVNGKQAFATVNPDGSVLADTSLHIERFSGRRVDAR